MFEMTKRKGAGLPLSCLEVGHGPLVVVLHGFPDTPLSFRPLLLALAEAGYHAVAPFLRGYAPSPLAPEGDYRLGSLAADLLALMEDCGAARADVVGHDWGSVIAQRAAQQAPHRFRHLVACSVPHLARFLAAVPGRQGWRSRYILQFQLRGGPEKWLLADDFAGLRALMQRWSPGWAITEADLAPLKERFADPAVLKAALSYYRQLPASVLADPAAIRRPIAVPTTMIHGAQDGCIGAEVFRDQSRWFSGGVTTVCLPDAGHFLVNEDPVAFTRAVLAALQRTAGEK